MSDIASEAKALFDRLLELQKSANKPDANEWIHSGLSRTPVSAERALTFAKDWISEMEEHTAINDSALAEFDMKCALYWLTFVINKTIKIQ